MAFSENKRALLCLLQNLGGSCALCARPPVPTSMLTLNALRIISRYKDSHLKGAFLESLQKTLSPVICFSKVIMDPMTKWGEDSKINS